MLERDYANLIADFRPLNDSGSPIVPTNRTNASTGSDPSGNALKLTKVRDRGETLYELARRSLGDSGQWFKIYRLNPTLSRDPKLPIPAGTVLRFPAEATVEAGRRAVNRKLIFIFAGGPLYDRRPSNTGRPGMALPPGRPSQAARERGESGARVTAPRLTF